MRREFPQAHIMTTFNSASTGGDFAPGLEAIIKGIAGRWSYEQIDRAASSQTMTPIEVLERRRYMDRDGDGRADIFDRLFDVNLHEVDRDLKHAFEARDPGRMPHRLQSLYGVTAANWCNRGVGAYNQAIHGMNSDSRVVSAGFFEGNPGDPPVRFEKTTLEDGRSGWSMMLNHRFAHAPEAVLRVIAAHELNAFLSRTESRYDFRDDALRTNVNSLLAVAFTLSHDRDQNDKKIFKQFLEAYGFPKDLDLYELEEFCEKNSADVWNEHGGNGTNINAFIEHLAEDEPELLEALRGDEVGQWRGL
jgi:hypothetical protein